MSIDKTSVLTSEQVKKKAGTDTLAALNAAIGDNKVMGLDLGKVKYIDRSGSDTDRGSRLETAINNANDGEVIVVHAGLNYQMSADATLGGSGINPHLVALGSSKSHQTYLTGNAVVLDTTGHTIGIDWTSSVNSEGFTDGSMPVKFSQSSGSATKAGVIKFCKSGNYSAGEWSDNNYNIKRSTIGDYFCTDQTNSGDMYDTDFGDYFCSEEINFGGLCNGKVTNCSFGILNAIGPTTFNNKVAYCTLPLSAKFCDSYLGTDGAFINCVDSNGVVFNSVQTEVQGTHHVNGHQDIKGYQVLDNGDFSAEGDARSGKYFRKISGASGSMTLSVPTDKMMNCHIQITATEAGMGSTGAFDRQVRIKNDGGTVSLVGSVNTIGGDADPGAVGYSVSITASSGNLSIDVSGGNSGTRWDCTIYATENANP